MLSNCYSLGIYHCNRWPCWTCEMQDERQMDWGVKSQRANKGSK